MAHQQPPEIQAILDIIDLMDDDIQIQELATRIEEITNVENPGPSSQYHVLLNPFYGVLVNGAFGSLCVTLGALFRHEPLANQALTYLVGGSVNGAAMGTIGMFLPQKKQFKESSPRIFMCLAICEASLELTSQLTSPLMGELILQKGTIWGQTVTNLLVGASFLMGCIGCLACLSGAAGLNIFHQTHDEDESLAPAEAEIPVRTFELETTVSQNTDLTPRAYALPV